ncbi:MAG TPA: helix-turn-helix transcriptional regulator [Bryobacteraceae bacterium]|nr:helix-turn-helix transcriptional regulator [Bryobacteraceae bacterium]
MSPKTPPARRAAATPAQLLKQLLAHAADPSGEELPDDASRAEEVLLDMDVDGARYLLLRLPKPGTPRVLLSPREQEIVRMVAQGHCNKVIAGVLSISSWTVCTHLRRIFAKMGVGSRAAMIARFMETGGAAGQKAWSANGGEARTQSATAGSLGAAAAMRARRSA